MSLLPRIRLAGRDATRLGLGVSGPHGFALSPERETCRLIARAYALGVRLFDSAPFYGVAQARLGRALAGVGDALIVSKAGTVRDAFGRTGKDFSPAGVRAAVERSLGELRRSRLDLLLLHGPPAGGLGEETLAALQGLQRAGSVGAVGVAGRGAEIAAALQSPLFTVVQAPVWSPWPAWCQARDVAFLGIEALAGVPRAVRAPTSIAQAWLLARRLYRGRGEGPAGAPGELLARALAAPGVCALLTTTTRLAHLEANVAAAAGADAGFCA